MSQVSKNELIYQNSVSFPNNNSGEISPADLRNFNVDLIDSTVNQTQYTQDSSSFDGRITGNTIAVNNLNAYTASATQEITAIEQFTSSINTFTQSIQQDVTQLLNASTSFEDKFDYIAIQSGSWGLDTGSLLTTGSNTFSGSQTITGSLNLQGPMNVNGTTNLTGSVNIDGDIFLDDDGGTTTFFINRNFNSEFKGIATRWYEGTQKAETIWAEKNTELILNAFSNSYDNTLYFNVNSTGSEFSDWDNTFTRTPWLKVPSQGTPAFQRGLQVTGSTQVDTFTASLQEGYVFVGNSSGKTQIIPTSSFEENTDLTSLNAFTASQQILNAQFADTGSNTFNGNQIINGTLTVNTPTASSESQIDFIKLPTFVGANGTTYVNSTFSLVDYASSGIDQTFFIEFANSSYQKYSAFEIGPSIGGFIIGKGSGYNYDTIEIKDNNNNTSTARIKADSVQLSGSVSFQNRAILNAGLQVTGSTQVQEVTASVIEITPNVSGNGLNLYQDGVSAIRFYSGSNQTQVGSWVNLQTNPANGALAISAFPLNNHFVDFNPFTSQSVFDSLARFDKGFETYNATSSFYGYTNVNGGISFNSTVDSNLRVAGQLFVTSANANFRDILMDDPGAITSFLQNPNFFTEFEGNALRWRENVSTSSFNMGEEEVEVILNAFSGSAYDDVLYLNVGKASVEFSDWNASYVRTPWLRIGKQQRPQFLRGLIVSGSTSVSGSVNGNVASITISSNTASLDFGSANFFTLNLVSGSQTRIEASNVKTGQTVNLKIVQPNDGVGTVIFPSQFKFPEVAPYSASIVTSSIDVVTFVTFEETGSIYSVATKRLV